MPRPISVPLTPSERRDLQLLRARTTSRRAWSRATALLMLASGEAASKAARVLSVSINTITHWKHRWRRHRYFRLTDAPRSGRPPKVTRRYQQLLKTAARQGPNAYRYGFTVWSSRRLAAHVERKTGTRLCAKSVRHWLKKLGFVYRRPKHTLKSRQNRKEVQAAERRLAALKKGL